MRMLEKTLFCVFVHCTASVSVGEHFEMMKKGKNENLWLDFFPSFPLSFLLVSLKGIKKSRCVHDN